MLVFPIDYSKQQQRRYDEGCCGQSTKRTIDEKKKKESRIDAKDFILLRDDENRLCSNDAPCVKNCNEARGNEAAEAHDSLFLDIA